MPNTPVETTFVDVGELFTKFIPTIPEEEAFFEIPITPLAPLVAVPITPALPCNDELVAAYTPLPFWLIPRKADEEELFENENPSNACPGKFSVEFCSSDGGSTM